MSNELSTNRKLLLLLLFLSQDRRSLGHHRRTYNNLLNSKLHMKNEFIGDVQFDIGPKGQSQVEHFHFKITCSSLFELNRHSNFIDHQQETEYEELICDVKFHRTNVKVKSNICQS